MTYFVPGTQEKDPSKVIMSLQQAHEKTATNTTDIATNTADIATNTADIATNTANIATNTANISTNTTNIATNTSDIAAMKAAWATYTPTITADAGSFTTVSAAGAYLVTGKTVHFTVSITITTVGTASGVINCPLPTGTAKRAFACAVREIGSTGVGGTASIATSATAARITKYDATTLAASGNVIVVSGTYETT